MNKIFTCLIAAMLLYTTHSIGQGVTFSAGNVTGDAGQQVCVPIKVTNFTNLVAFTYSISFDPSVLQFSSISNIGLPNMTAPPAITNFGIPGPGSNVPQGKIAVLWDDNTFLGVDRANGATIFEVCFNIIENSGVSSTTVGFSEVPTQYDVLDATFSTLPLIPQSGTVTINGNNGGGGKPFKMILADASANQNTDVCLNMSVEGFTDIVSWQYQLTYDAARLQFLSVGSYNLTGLDDGDVTVPGEGSIQAGRISFSWDNNTGLTVPDGTNIFQVCFKVLAGSGNSTISFANDLIPFGVTNTGGAITFNSDNGVITSTGGGVNTDVFKISVEDKEAASGAQVCLNVEVEGFNDIVSWQYHLTYNPSRLQFVSVGNFSAGLPGLTDQSVTTPGEGVVQPGRIVFGWDSSTGIGVTVPDGTAILQLCFNVLATGGTATISFNDDQLPFEIRETDGTLVDFLFDNGVVTLAGGNGGGNTDIFKISVEDKEAQSGTQVCLNVEVEGFNDIVSWQYHLRYDPARLQFVSVGNFSALLPGLTDQSVTTPGEGVVQPGRIVFGWDSSTGVGVTVPDGTAILQLCFNVLATAGTATISFTEDQLPYEVRETNGTLVPFLSDNGVVTIAGGAGDFRLVASNEMAQSGGQVCVDVTVDNMTGILGITMGMSYDPAALKFVSITPSNLPALLQLGTPTTAPPLAEGLISIVWFDQTLAGVTLAPGTKLFEICFDVLGANGTTTEVQFGDIPPTLEQDVVNTAQQTVPFSTQRGTITIGSSAIVLPTPTITNVNCFGASTGAIDLQPTGGSGNFTYSWSNGRTTQDLADVPAGTYGVTVTDTGNSSTATGSYVVTQPSAALAIGTVTVSDVDCNTTNTGSIVLSVTGGTTPYTYNWSGALPDNVSTQNNLAMGQYSVTITDNRNCTINSGTINVAQNSDILVNSIVPVDIDQGNDGAVNISVSGGSGTFTYNWSGPNGYTSTQRNINNLSAQGQYCVTVTDNSGCTTTSCTMVNQRLKIGSVQIARACAGTSNGGVNLTVTGGQPGYTYSWSNGTTQANLSNVGVGTYGVTVTDNGGGTVTGSFEVNAFAQINLNPTILKASAGGSNGEISLNVSGGNAPYTIQWGANTNNATTARITNLAAGEYCVTVTDNRGCSTQSCFTVEEQTIPLSITNIQIGDVVCPGGTTGSISFNIQGGRAPYTVAFSDGSSIQSNNGVISKMNLPGGMVSFTITDDVGTDFSSTASISEPAPMQIDGVTILHDTEDPGCTGRISLSISGGSPNYQVQWNSPNTGMQIINLCEGTFVPTVRDGKGCSQTFPGIELNTFALDAQVEDVSCPQDQDGKISLDVVGGVAPYSYSWRNAENEEVSTDSILGDVPTGVYTVRVSEESGNTLVRQYTIGSTSNLTVNSEVISDYNGSDISCLNAADGIIEASGRNSDGNYTYEWRRGGNTLSTTQPVFTGAMAGTYEVIVTDGFGCKANSEVEVRPPTPIEITANIRDVSCPGNKDGEIVASATGGAMGRPFTYAWGNGTNGQRISFLAAGTYTVSATDANNCIATTNFILEEPKPIQVQVQTQAASDDCNGMAMAVVEGGTPPYSYTWNASGAANSAVLSNLCPGPYFVQVTDSRGCRTPNMVSGLVEDDRYPCIESSVVLTPNDGGGDGLNDQFRINCIEEFSSTHLEVYNRWGQLVFEMDNYDNSWGGTNQNGDMLPEGPYYFVIEYVDVDNKLIQRKGSITLLRDN